MLGIGRHGPLGPLAAHLPEAEGGDGAPARDRGPGADSRAPGAGTRGASASPAVAALSEADALAVITSATGVGPIFLERLLEAFGDPREVLAAALVPSGVRALLAASRDPDPDRRGHAMSDGAAEALAVAARQPRRIIDAMAAAGVAPLSSTDSRYPERLRRIELPPRVLFVRGEVAALEAGHAVAVVGTRRPTDAGRRTAARLGAALARAGALVTSGLATGIDGAAHQAVVLANGRTVGVIGGGHDRLFPKSHDHLADAIVASGGAIVSEHPPGTEPTRGTFPRRNRIISGLADAVVVVEAGATSGALVTARWALDQGRDLFVVPGPIDAPESAGCLSWLREFPGEARIVAGIPQLLDDLGLVAAAAFPAALPSPLPARRSSPATAPSLRPSPRPVHEPTSAARRLELAPREARLADALVAGAATVDELVAVTTMPLAAVLGGLTALEARGLVTGTFGRYRPAGRLEMEPPARAGDPAA